MALPPLELFSLEEKAACCRVAFSFPLCGFELGAMLVLWCIPIVAVLYALPLLCGWVGPNPIYGYRNQKTRANANLWYQANRTAGMYLIVAMAICVALEFAVPGLHRGAAAHIAAPLVQISGLIIANALTTVHVLRMEMKRKRPHATRPN